MHPGAEANVVRTAELLRDEAEVLDALVAAEVRGRRIPVERLAALAPALRRLVVQRLADDAAGGLVPGAGRRAEEIAALGRSGALDVGGGVRANVASRGAVLRRLRGPGRAAARARPRPGRPPRWRGEPDATRPSARCSSPTPSSSARVAELGAEI